MQRRIQNTAKKSMESEPTSVTHTDVAGEKGVSLDVTFTHDTDGADVERVHNTLEIALPENIQNLLSEWPNGMSDDRHSNN